MKKLTALLAFSLFSCSSVIKFENQDSISLAYVQQKSLVENSNKTIIGYKAGLTSKVGQAKFGVTEPVAGVLFKSGLSTNRQAYQLAHYQKLMLETEIGFTLNSDLNHSINKPEQLHKIIDTVFPVIELPNLAYPDLSKVTGLTLIKTNVATNQILIGRQQPLGDIQLNAIQTQLLRNGQTLIQGQATDAMGDQLIALQWLLNRLIKSGYSIKKGDILITGALGSMIPAQVGQYDADFGPLGQLSFSIR
ncbi:2-keto-4-pentenoate hydratase [Kangiella sp. HZ709]|uniref:2-keto-4-pentenoate hydratase n=1 Tax=Kangiella sp. HZ709 TaxID=2666328 RepID=UPI0012AF6457|nr:4-oxalocrotonate decarboxylase [Kangiella sp. HZ709]MRX28038.1 4-oxalocrotonate decarboxylase [Kangiella sp. HZ709]